jgi:phosphoglycolate phosphatase-like HAD superfamily hydrolase
MASSAFWGYQLPTVGYANDRPILEALNDLPAAQAAQLHQQLDALELDIAHRATAQVGARELLTKLRSRGAQIGILTRNSKPNAQATLVACGLAEFFPAELILSRHCCPPKPSPDGIWQLLPLLECIPRSIGHGGRLCIRS